MSYIIVVMKNETNQLKGEEMKNATGSKLARMADIFNHSLHVADSYAGMKIRKDVRAKQIRQVELAQAALDALVLSASVADRDGLDASQLRAVEDTARRLLQIG